MFLLATRSCGGRNVTLWHCAAIFWSMTIILFIFVCFC